MTVDVGQVWKAISTFMAPLFLLVLPVLREVSFGRDEISHFRRLIFLPCCDNVLEGMEFLR